MKWRPSRRHCSAAVACRKVLPVVDRTHWAVSPRSLALARFAAAYSRCCARIFSRWASRLGTLRLPDLVGICGSPLLAVLPEFPPIGGAPLALELSAFLGGRVRH